MLIPGDVKAFRYPCEKNIGSVLMILLQFSDTVRVDDDEGDDPGNDYNDNKEEKDTAIPEKIYIS